MSVRSVIVRLEAEVAGYVAGMGRAGTATDNVARQVVQARRSIDDNRAAMDTAGKTMLGFGTVSVAALGASAKAAMDWESAWAGVTKTVDGSPEQMNELEASLRGLAKTLPATHGEIAGVAEAAGQLGVAREDVVGFTKTMIDLGNTTNLTADEAATSIAQISNVMGTMARDGSVGVERFGATLVALGNAGASTEKEILEMAKRIAGAGKLVGASESDILALSNAMASVGIEAQLGGGVMSRVMQRMYGDVMKGGEGLDNLAKTAGVSSKDFATAFETDPVRAVDMMVKGLSRVKDEGGNVMDTMDGLGIKGTEETGVILRLAGAGDLLSDSLKLGDAAWASNSALAEEAAKRYETTESKVKVAWNNIKDAAIDAGAVLLPVIQGIAESVSGLAQMFGDLPAPVQGIVTTLGGVVGVAALLGGGLLTLIPKINDTRNAFRTMEQSGSRIPGMMGRVAKVGGVVAGLTTVVTVLAKLAESDYMSKIDTGMGKVSLALVDVANSSPGAAAGIDSLFKDRDGGDLINTVDGLDSALKRTFNRDGGQQFNDWGESLVNGMTGVKGSSQILGDQFDRLDQGLADLVSSGKSEDAAKNFDLIKAAADEQGISVDDLITKFPAYADALKKAEADGKGAGEGGDKAAAGIKAAGEAAEIAAAQTEEIEKALDEVGLSADGAVTDIGKFTAALFNAGLISLSASDASIAYQDAIDKMTESVTTNGTTLDLNTEAGRANQSAFNGLARAAIATAEATATETLATQGSAAAQAQLQTSLRTSYDDLVAAAGQFGIVGDEADTMARKALGVPKNVNIDAWIADHASQTLEGIKGKADNLDGRQVNISIRETTYLHTERSESVSSGAGTNNSAQRTYHADGGEIRGPGTSTSDEVPIMASAGEHMFDRGDVIRMGGQQAVYRFRAQLRAGIVPAYAGGGAVGTVASASQLMVHHAQPAAAAAGSGTFEGNLFLDSGEFLGKVRGVARQEASGVVAHADGQSRYIRKGR